MSREYFCIAWFSLILCFLKPEVHGLGFSNFRNRSIYPTTSTPRTTITPRQPLPADTFVVDHSSFIHHDDCNYNTTDEYDSDFPDLGSDFEFELEAKHMSSNATYKTSTYSDVTNSRGVVVMDFNGFREVSFYDLKQGKSYRIRGMN